MNAQNMNNMDFWLTKQETPSHHALMVAETWQPIFEPDRHLVSIKMGPYWRLYERPEGFVKRFYHTVYALPIEKWLLDTHVELYEGFCNVGVRVDIHFQAGIKYALNNMAVLASINAHIQSTYEEALMNSVHDTLLNLPKDVWIRNALGLVEKKIASDMSEMFMLQAIQSRVLCELTPVFKDFPDVILSQEEIYLSLLKKNFEFNQAKRDEHFRQQTEIDNQAREQTQKNIENLEQDARLEREKQATIAANTLRLREEFARQQAALFEVEERIHTEQLAHDSALKEKAFESAMALEKKQHAKTLSQKTQQKEDEITREIMLYEKEQAQWLAAKTKIQAHENTLSKIPPKTK
ncbi:MAG TPA: hypothetical protein DF614_01580 [Methylococcaceae bacterium]|nr:hypothetical protein [Methylococcaceae bacterium]